MAGYKKPRARLHREFVYLNTDTVINSLSGFQAGKIDEIIEKVTEGREGGVEGSVGVTGAKVRGGKRKSANIEEELRRTRTNFSAFEEWYRYLEDEGGFGELQDWDLDTRNELGVGDTIKVAARVSLSPVQQVLLTFIDFSKQAGEPDSVMRLPPAQLQETKKQARRVSGWMKGRDGQMSILVSVAPLGTDSPRVFARLDERYLVNGLGPIEGEVIVIGQIEALVEEGEYVPAIRVLRETPPTQLETDTITEALGNLIEPAAGLGVTISSDDITFGYPAVLMHPIAFFR